MDRALIKDFIAKRVAKELRDGDVVNLGIGIPTLVPKYLPEGVSVVLQSENGIVGVGRITEDNADPMHITDAAGQPAVAMPGGVYVDSATSFGLIRGGHVDACILGGLEVDAEGSLSNWIIPGKRMPGMGGAMDLLVGTRKVIVAMEHTARGNPKIVEKCSLPYTAVNCVSMIITEMGVMELTEAGITLVEINPEFSVEEVQQATAAKLIISPDLKPMV
ncbi:MAG: 3-oxoacid CoA-transferase subunit B [Clostridia bacterium]|nr:3-oxoacid CoA-transferase subunit B [Clostridia bacterium]